MVGIDNFNPRIHFWSGWNGDRMQSVENINSWAEEMSYRTSVYVYIEVIMLEKFAIWNLSVQLPLDMRTQHIVKPVVPNRLKPKFTKR